MSMFRKGMMGTVGMFLLNEAAKQFGYDPSHDAAQRRYERKASRKGIGGMPPPKNGPAECYRRQQQIRLGELRLENGLATTEQDNNIHSHNNIRGTNHV